MNLRVSLSLLLIMTSLAAAEPERIEPDLGALASGKVSPI